MKAVGYVQSLPPSDPQSLIDFEAEAPIPGARDLLVSVRAVSVNPIDCKVRMRVQGTPERPRILGFDCAGVVLAAGPEVSLFKPGDEVFYAGSILRQGTNAELHLVDERLAGPKPRTLSFAQAAALPLTSITAWELLFDRLRIPLGRPQRAGSLLIIGAGGGVGSILAQLARRLTGVTVLASASRPETREWVLGHGAHHAVDHSKSLCEEVRALGFANMEYIISLNQSGEHFDEIVELIAPQGAFALIDDPTAIDVTRLKAKSASLHWESMFTRSSFQTPDMIEQHRILAQLSSLVDDGILRTTLAQVAGTIHAQNLRTAHATLESHHSIGKIVLEGF
jgi:zinc-binding alcohol dehydrogenase family protein